MGVSRGAVMAVYCQSKEVNLIYFRKQVLGKPVSTGLSLITIIFVLKLNYYLSFSSFSNINLNCNFPSLILYK